MGYLDLSAVTVVLPDGRAVLDEVSLRVGEGARMALVGPNGSGKTTLLRVASGDLPVGGAGAGGAVVGAGGLGVMRQLIGQIHDDSTVRDLLVAVAPPRIGAAAAEITRTELLMMERDEHDDQLAYAQALADWADVGGYEWETLWDVCTVAALGVPYERAQYRSLRTLSGGEQKRLALEALLRGPDEVLLLDEPDNFLDVPGKRWLEEQLVGCDKTVLFVSHDRELLARVATRVATLEPSSAGSRLWVHPGGFATYDQARVDRNDRLEEQRRRWDEEHAKLRELVVMYRQKAAYNSDMAARLQAARTRLRRFEEAGPPEEVPVPQRLRMRLTGGRTAKRSIIAEQCELTGLMQAFDLEVWYGDRVAVLGSNGSGKSHFLRLLAQGGSDPSPEHALVAAVPDGAGERAGSARTAGEAGAPDGGPGGHRVAHTGTVRLGSRVRPGWFAQTHDQPQLRGRTLLEILHRGDDHRTGRPRDEASRALDRYGLARAGEQRFESLSGGQQARFQILLLELSGATLLLLDEPTDNLDLVSAEALEEALDAFDGTVVAVTHDRWFARRFDRFVVFGADGTVYESPEPVWDEARVRRPR